MFTRRSSSSILDLQTMLWLTPEVLRRSSVVSLGSATESARLHRHFFAKLERGEPVTILGVGSSVTKGAGGCSVSLGRRRTGQRAATSARTATCCI